MGLSPRCAGSTHTSPVVTLVEGSRGVRLAPPVRGHTSRFVAVAVNPFSQASGVRAAGDIAPSMAARVPSPTSAVGAVAAHLLGHIAVQDEQAEVVGDLGGAGDDERPAEGGV